eukprot:NODE_709_length_4544_cov_1.024072.p4 type:complete len:249 gc:universal NODE_709_length_4544_cov_1.024072:2169-2915(+)
MYESTFWGKPTALVNWCEPDYVYTPFIAETFNTLSNFYTILLGIILYRHYSRHHDEKRFLVTSLIIIFVGIGSSAFHGTLLYHFQLLDELPMLYLTCAMSYMIAEISSKPKQYKYPNLPYILLAGCIFMTIAHIFVQNAELFFSVFGILVSPSIFYPFTISDDFVYTGAMKKSLFFCCVGFICWEVDRFFCDYTQFMHLHSFWHIFSAICGTYWMNGTMYMRRKILKLPVTLKYGGLWIEFDSSKKTK